MVAGKLGTMFHESFSLSRESLRQVLSVVLDNGSVNFSSQEKRFDVLRESTNLGTNYVKAMPKYAKGAGLLDDSFEASLFGAMTYQKDRLMSLPSTLWLIHYHLSVPEGLGPSFWNELVLNNFRSGNEFGKDDVEKQIKDFYEHTENEILANRSISSTATIFLGTYIKSDGLGGLNLLQQVQQNRYKVNDDLDSPPTWAVAYAIVDFWKKNFPDRQTINLDELTEGNSVANIFMIGAGKVANILQKMQVEGFVDLYRVAPPYQVVLLRPDLQAILEKIYENE
jgi:hypothetical protein